MRHSNDFQMIFRHFSPSVLPGMGFWKNRFAHIQTRKTGNWIFDFGKCACQERGTRSSSSTGTTYAPTLVCNADSSFHHCSCCCAVVPRGLRQLLPTQDESPGVPKSWSPDTGSASFCIPSGRAWSSTCAGGNEIFNNKANTRTHSQINGYLCALHNWVGVAGVASLTLICRLSSDFVVERRSTKLKLIANDLSSCLSAFSTTVEPLNHPSLSQQLNDLSYTNYRSLASSQRHAHRPPCRAISDI